MKKLFTLLLLTMMSFSLTFASGTFDHRSDDVIKTDTTKLKKDGTPDKRMKANKTAPTTSATGQHLKKDGTPDKRYKENKTKKTS